MNEKSFIYWSEKIANLYISALILSLNMRLLLFGWHFDKLSAQEYLCSPLFKKLQQQFS